MFVLLAAVFGFGFADAVAGSLLSAVSVSADAEVGGSVSVMISKAPVT